jgi:hypothetical protein
MAFSTYQKTWLFLILIVVIIGFVNLYYKTPFYQEYFEENLDVSKAEEDRFIKECYERQCAPLEIEYQRQCELIRLRCAESHMFDFQKCKDDIKSMCNSSDIENCASTCGTLWNVEKNARNARRQMVRTVTGTILQRDEVNLAQVNAYQLSQRPPINFYAGPEYTIEFMINPRSASSTWRTVVFFTSGNGDVRIPAIWLHPGGNYPRLHIRHSTRNFPYGGGFNTTENAMTYNEWSHIVVVISKTGGRVYVNGELSGEEQLRFGDIYVWGNATNYQYYLRHPLSVEVHSGPLLMKRITWYTKALSNEEVQQTYALKNE